MKSIQLFALLSVLPFVGVMAEDLDYVHPSRLGLSEERLQVIERIVEQAIDRKEIPHAAVLVARHGKIAYEGFFGFADVADGRILQEDAIFRIASMTKLVTNVATMMLFEEGAFLMEDPLSNYIPAFKGSQVAEIDPHTGALIQVRDAQRPITIRDVLTHRAGMSYGALLPENNYLRKKYEEEGLALLTPFTLDESLESYVNRFATMPMVADPGVQIDYGVATDVLGRLVEIWSDQSLEDFFYQRIFQPLGMNDTGFFVPEGSKESERIPTLYAWQEGNTFDLDTEDHAFFHAMGPQRLFAGAVGLLSTPRDYFRFCQMMLNQGRYAGHRLLSPKSVALIVSNQTGETPVPEFLQVYGDQQGFGVMVRTATGSPWSGLESLGTLSFAGGFFTRFWIDPREDMIIMAMTSMFNLSHLHGFTHKVKNAALHAINVENGRTPRFKE